MDLANRTILITGSSDGIGKVLAIEFSKLGSNIILLGRDSSKLDQVYDQLDRSFKSQKHLILQADLALLSNESAHEILRAITHYLRKDSKKAEEIFHYVFQNDPNIFKKKYDNDWVNIDLMMCRLFEFINDQDPVDFFKDRSDTHAYNEFFAELFDSIFDQLDQVNIPPFSLQ